MSGIVFLSLNSCLSTTNPNKPKPTQEVITFVGEKEKCIEFLNSPFAQSDRYVVEAMK